MRKQPANKPTTTKKKRKEKKVEKRQSIRIELRIPTQKLNRKKSEDSKPKQNNFKSIVNKSIFFLSFRLHLPLYYILRNTKQSTLSFMHTNTSIRYLKSIYIYTSIYIHRSEWWFRNTLHIDSITRAFSILTILFYWFSTFDWKSNAMLSMYWHLIFTSKYLVQIPSSYC